MEYSIYKLDFQTGVHFGTGMLNESAYTFQADQLFSALYIEALKMGAEQDFYQAVKEGKLLFSDAFPYKNEQFMIPKPMIYVEPKEKGVSEQKKAYKKLKFLPIEELDAFLDGMMDITAEDPMKDFGNFQQQTMASVRGQEETTPFRVGTFYFSKPDSNQKTGEPKPDCGLYIIVAHSDQEKKYLAEDLLNALSFAGIGGKKSSGLGRYELVEVRKIPKAFLERLDQPSDRNILLSSALPMDDELEQALEDASYLMQKRSGFVASAIYADEWRKKRDLYVFSAGSCFKNCFQGDIFDVSDGGRHPVYRYAKPLFMGV